MKKEEEKVEEKEKGQEEEQEEEQEENKEEYVDCDYYLLLYFIERLLSIFCFFSHRL